LVVLLGDIKLLDKVYKIGHV